MPLPTMEEIRRLDAGIKADVARAYDANEKAIAALVAVAFAAFLGAMFL